MTIQMFPVSLDLQRAFSQLEAVPAFGLHLGDLSHLSSASGMCLGSDHPTLPGSVLMWPAWGSSREESQL